MKSLWQWLCDVALGPRCPFCGQREVGQRHLDRHVWLDHGDEEPRHA